MQLCAGICGQVAQAGNRAQLQTAPILRDRVNFCSTERRRTTQKVTNGSTSLERLLPFMVAPSCDSSIKHIQGLFERQG